MSNVPKHLIEEARKRGIVPGARIQCAVVNRVCLGTVSPIKDWSETKGSFWVGNDDFGAALGARSVNGTWATVITPAPQSEPEGLKEGDAVECGPAMRAAIVEMAKELGLDCSHAVKYLSGAKGLHLAYSTSGICAWISGDTRKPHTPEAFIAKMRVTATLPKPIKIGDYAVEFLANGDIKAGGTSVDFATLEAVYDRAKQNRP